MNQYTKTSILKRFEKKYAQFNELVDSKHFFKLSKHAKKHFLTEVSSLYQSVSAFYPPKALKKTLKIGSLLLLLQTGALNSQAQSFDPVVFNPYGLSFENRSTVDFDGEFNSSSYVDMDNDGDLDLISNQLFIASDSDIPQQYFQLIENIGSPNQLDLSSEPTTIVEVGSNMLITKLVGVDIDNDGDKDVVGLSYSYGPNDEEITSLAFIENTGTATEPSFGSLDLTSYKVPADLDQNSFTMHDIDNDGDIDIIGHKESGDDSQTRLVMLENIGSPTAPEFAAEMKELMDTDIPYTHYSTFLELADLDNDGDLDAWFMASERMGIVTNNGSASAPDFGSFEEIDWNLPEGFDEYETAEMTFIGITPSLVDIDQDGDFDLLIDGVSSLNNADGSRGYDLIPGTLFYENQDIVASTNTFSNVGLSLKLYPSPATDFVQLNIAFDLHPVQVAKVQVYDQGGRLVQSQDLFDQTLRLDVAQYPAGLYQVQVTVGEQVLVEGFVKQ